jgi:hypothetical protein
MSYSKIKKLIAQGYEFRIPGGKSKRESYEEVHASFGVIPRRKIFLSSGREVIEILVIPQLKKELQVKYIAPEKKYNESPRGTLEREVGEETGVRLQEYDVLKEIAFSDSANIHDKHMKYAYISTLYDASNIRKKFSPSQPNLGIPLWISLDLLDKVIYPRHKWILSEAKNFIGYFCNKIPCVYIKPSR